MLKRAPTSLAAYLFVTVALAKNFPLRERLLSRYGGKSDQTPVPSMKMGSQMQMSLGTPVNATNQGMIDVRDTENSAGPDWISAPRFFSRSCVRFRTS